MDNNNPFLCSQCDQTFATTQDVFAHVTQAHQLPNDGGGQATSDAEPLSPQSEEVGVNPIAPATHEETNPNLTPNETQTNPDIQPLTQQVSDVTASVIAEKVAEQEQPIVQTNANEIVKEDVKSEDNNKRPVGRPSKYRPEFCEKVIGHMAQGYSVESFGAIAEVAKSTIYEWIDTIPEFSDAVEIGRQKSLLFWETIGINGTVGKPNYYKDKITGKEMPTDKFNSQTYALHMANKHKWVSAKTDITTDGEKIDMAPRIIMDTKPKEEKDNA